MRCSADCCQVKNGHFGLEVRLVSLATSSSGCGCWEFKVVGGAGFVDSECVRRCNPGGAEPLESVLAWASGAQEPHGGVCAVASRVHVRPGAAVEGD